MKHLKIIGTLTVVVLLCSVMVFGVEGFTTPIIRDYNLQQANAAKFDVLPELSSDDSGYETPAENYDLEGTSIDNVYVVDGVGYIYEATFQGFQSQITYMIGVDTDGNITGYKTLAQGDTPGYGAQIANPGFWTQFSSLTTSDVQDGDFDGLSGATITTGGLKGSLNKVMTFHKVTFEGETVETPEERLERFKQEITPDDSTFTDVSSNYSLDSSVVQKVEIANDGVADVAVIYTATADGYADEPIRYMISFDLTTNDVLGYRVISHNETGGIGSLIAEDDFAEQFVDLSQQDALDGNIDSVSGATAPVTLGGLRDSINKVTRFHQAEFQGISNKTPEEKRQDFIKELFPTMSYTDVVTRDYPADHDINIIYDVYDDTDTYLGVAYFVHTMGAGYGGTETFIEFIFGVNEDNTVSGFRMVNDSETPGRADDFYGESYDDSFEGDDADSAIVIDAVANSTLTKDALQSAIDKVLDFHNDNYLQRPEPTVVDNAELSAAYPTAASFNSVYLTYPEANNILNLYEALDGSDQVIGYVYYAEAYGYGGRMTFTWGVDTSGVAQAFNVITQGESWDDAEAYASYDGSEGYFPNTPWLNSFEGATFSSILTGISDESIDAVSGVSTTTDGLLTVIEAIAQYHSDNSIGGA